MSNQTNPNENISFFKRGWYALKNSHIKTEMFQTKGTKEILQLNAIYDPRLNPGCKEKHGLKDIRSNDKTETWKSV